MSSFGRRLFSIPLFVSCINSVFFLNEVLMINSKTIQTKQVTQGTEKNKLCNMIIRTGKESI